MKGYTSISINEKQTECRYLFKNGVVKHLNLLIGGKWVGMDDLLNIDEVYLALDAHHQNLLQEDNCES